MNNILLITASPRGAASYSTTVATALAGRLADAHPGAVVTHRDLGAEPLPHLDGMLLSALSAANRDGLSPQVLASALRADAAIAQLFAADAIVIAAPMINFGMSTQLKSWFDHVLRAGTTFGYSEAGPKGLVTGKKVYVVTASGGVYSEGPLTSIDFHAPYVKTLLNFIGLTDIEHIAVEGVKLTPDAGEKAVAAALQKVAALTLEAAA
jgi:FMN-dependent NADH-azoreductase